MSDVGIQRGDVPGGPPLNLPSLGSVPPPRITIQPDPSRVVPFAPPRNVSIAPQNPHAFLEDYEPTPEEKKSAPKGNPHAFLEDYKPDEHAEATPRPEVSGTSAAISGGLNALSFGFAPAIAGLAAAAGPEWQSVDIYQNADKPVPNLVAPVVGAAKLLHGYLSGHPDESVRNAYEKGRQEALESQQGAEEQHPHAYLAGQFAGSLLSPSFIAMKAANLGGRIGRGLASGFVGGGLYGAGSATSAGGSPSDIEWGAGTGAALGAPLGGAMGGVLGPRVVNPNSPGQRAAATAQWLGKPLPRGVVSDNRAVQSTTARLRQIPFGGEKIGEGVEDTAQAAGSHLGNIADQMAGGATDRAAADTIIRPALRDVIDRNRQTIDQAYGDLRSQIDTNAQFTMPRTDAALNGIMADRAAAGWANPAQGLEQFRTVAGGATFNGAHRARVDAREAGNVLSPNPGYNKADFNRITRAMTADLRDMVRHAATGNPRDALAAFDAAEQQFGQLAEQNGLLHTLADAPGEGAIAKLMGSAKAAGGNLRLLAQLRNSMPPQDFELIGGVLLHELGHNKATGEFSLNKLVTGWDRDNLSDRAKNVLFSPQHLADINEIVGMGSHIKGALRESSTSHSNNMLVMLDVAKDAALLGHDILSGGLGVGSAIGAATTVGLWLLTRWLASPAKAASMSAWARSYRAIAGGRPNPAQIAAFNMTTRNLANNLGVPAQAILKSVQLRLGRSEVSSSGENEPQNQ